MEPAIEALRPALKTLIERLALRDVSDAQLDALLGYLARLQRWNATYNLTSVREPEQMLTQHLADCLAVIEPLGRRLEAGRLLDVGSGGGLPGIVIAIMRPRVDVTCVDSVGKKAAFIQQVAGELRLRNLHAEHTRVEHLKAAPFDVITSRAFASLTDFGALTRRHLAASGLWMAMKGKTPNEELAGLPADIELFHVEQLAVPGLDAERCLIWMRPKR
jgi:16S rRNA (guanine527-N7)-methyltransferase